MTITLRTTKGSELTYAELDGNFTDLDTRVLSLEADSADSRLISLEGGNFQSRITTLENTYISLATLKAEVAASIDFADFQSRIAAL